MNKLSGHTGRENNITDIEPYYPAEYEGVSADGYYGLQDQSNEKQLFSKFLASMRKHWLLIFALNLLVTGAAIFYVAQKPDYYRADARIQVNAEFNPAAGLNSEGGSIIINPANDPVYFQTQVQILEGPGLMRRVAKDLDLENNPAFLNPYGDQRPTAWQNVKRMFGLYRPPLPKQYASAGKPKDSAPENELSLQADETVNPDKEAERLAPYVAVLKSGLKINPVQNSRLIEVSFTHGDPEIAAKVVNTISDVYVLQNLENKVKSNTSAGDFLQKRVAELQSMIRQGEERLINYAKNNQIVSLDAGQNTVVQRFSDLNQQLGQAENARIAAQTAYQAALQNKMREATVQSQDTQVSALEGQLNALKQRLAQLKTEYTDEWYEVVQTKKQIQTIEGQLQTLRKRATDIQIATLEERLNEALARERELRASFDQQRSEVIRQNEASINYRIIQQEINTNKTLLDQLLQRSRENDLILTRTPNNVQVVDRALVPNGPVGPERARDVGLAFLLSLSFGIGLAFVIDWFNESVQHSEDIESLFGLPVLASIPAAPRLLSRKVLPTGLRRKNLKNYNLKAFDRTEFQESYLQLGARLLLSSPGDPPQTILVTSGEEGEGKTLTALNLAKSLTETGKKVLLIDADLRCPKIHGLLNRSNHVGLTTLLAGDNITDEVLEAAIIKDASGTLDVLTSGGRTVSPANLLTSAEMRGLLEKLRERYAHVVIDTPPVLYFADSLILSTLSDAVVLVVRDNFSSRRAIQQVKKMLNTVGARIAGIVMNGVPLRWAAYYKYRDYEVGEDLSPIDGEQAILKL